MLSLTIGTQQNTVWIPDSAVGSSDGKDELVLLHFVAAGIMKLRIGGCNYSGPVGRSRCSGNRQG